MLFFLVYCMYIIEYIITINRLFACTSIVTYPI